MEMAIVLPLLMMLTMGVIHYSWLFLKAQQITNAARSGARVGIVNPSAITASVDTLMTAAGMGASGYTVSSVLGTNSGDPVTVTVAISKENVAMKVALINAPSLLPLPPNGLHASVTMAKEGP